MSAASMERFRFRDLMRPNSRPYTLGDDQDANLVGIRLYGVGPFHRELKPAMQIAKKTHFVIRAGDVIYNKLFAWKGTFGIVPPDLDGMYVSDKFPTYELNRARVDERYLRWFFRHPDVWEQARVMSTGSAALSKLTLNPPKFLDLEIPLPPLDEQLRIVTRIDELAAKVEEAQGLRHSLQQEILILPRALLGQQPSHRKIRVREFAALRSPNVKVDPLQEYHFAGVYSFGRGVFQGQRKLGSEFAYPKLTRLQAGNFVYPKLMAWEGALGIVPPECDGLVVSTEFPVFEIDAKLMLPEVVDTYFRSPEISPSLSSQSGGTNVRRRRLNPNDFLNLQMPWPDQATQAVIRQCVSRVSAIGTIQSETAAELDAMLPAILDKAFKGHL